MIPNHLAMQEENRRSCTTMDMKTENKKPVDDRQWRGESVL
jgi:hypothetical protein